MSNIYVPEKFTLAISSRNWYSNLTETRTHNEIDTDLRM